MMLERLANHLEKSEALRATLRTALIYPCAVLAVAGVVLVLILVCVVPAFQNIFASFGAELPWLTRVVIDLSESVQHQGPISLAALGVVVFWFKRQIAQRPHWQRAAHRVMLHLPIAGPLTRQACTARWTRTLATLFAAGVPLTEALGAMPGVTGNVLFQAATQTIQSQLMQGTSLSRALESNGGLFPPMAVQMCAIGEESGALDHMLAKTAEYYEREVDHTVVRLSTLLEPCIMVVLGLLIGGLVMALYLPIFQLGQVV
jgi:type IV pilus assembly protein PilC